MCKHKRPNQIDDCQLKQMLMTRASGTECVCLEVFLERRSRRRGDANQTQSGKTVTWIEFRRFGTGVVATTVNIHTESLKYGCWNSRSVMDA
jgi:hypothetical protein